MSSNKKLFVSAFLHICAYVLWWLAYPCACNERMKEASRRKTNIYVVFKRNIHEQRGFYVHCSWISWEKGWWWEGRPETHTKRQATQQGCLPSLLGDGDKGIEQWISVRGGKTYFVLRPTRAAKAEQKSFVPAPKDQQTNKGRTPFICTHWVSIHLSFNSQQVPPLSSLSGVNFTSPAPTQLCSRRCLDRYLKKTYTFSSVWGIFLVS
jgi:hypothetical protein